MKQRRAQFVYDLQTACELPAFRTTPRTPAPMLCNFTNFNPTTNFLFSHRPLLLAAPMPDYWLASCFQDRMPVCALVRREEKLVRHDLRPQVLVPEGKVRVLQPILRPFS